MFIRMPTERWLNVFDDTEVRELVEALQHEWRESAIRPADYLRDLKRTAPIRSA